MLSSCGVSNTGERSVGLPVPTSSCFWLVYSARCGRPRTGSPSGIGCAVLRFRALEDRFAALLRRGQLAIRQSKAVRAERQRVDEGHQIGELLLVVALRAVEEFFRARAALGRQSGLPPFHLKGSVPAEFFERAVVDDVLAEAVRLEVPLQTVEGGVEVAVGAAEVALEGKVGGVEETLAAAQGVDTLPARRGRSWRSTLSRGSYRSRERVVESIGDVKALAIGREQQRLRGLWPTGILAVT